MYSLKSLTTRAIFCMIYRGNSQTVQHDLQSAPTGKNRNIFINAHLRQTNSGGLMQGRSSLFWVRPIKTQSHESSVPVYHIPPQHAAEPTGVSKMQLHGVTADACWPTNHKDKEQDGPEKRTKVQIAGFAADTGWQQLVQSHLGDSGYKAHRTMKSNQHKHSN